MEKAYKLQRRHFKPITGQGYYFSENSLNKKSISDEVRIGANLLLLSVYNTSVFTVPTIGVILGLEKLLN